MILKISSQYIFDYQKRIYMPERCVSSSGRRVVSLPEVVGKGYGIFWKWRGRYRVCKGSRASKKSKTTALWYITNLMKYPDANLLVVRKVFRTLKDSCFTELKWAINRLGVQNHWEIKESPLEMTYKPTGQKIYFRGLDDPLKVTSITVEHGYLCWMWVEEAYEIGNEDDFNMLDESIRGAIPQETGLFKQITLTFNPWNEHHWIKKRFFDNPDDETLAMTTNYLCNEWLDEADRKVFETMRLNNPRRYRVAGLGDWGIVDGLIFENWEEKAFDIDKVRRLASVKSAFGLDFGYTNDPSALFCGLVDESAKTLWVFDEMYKYGMSNERIASEVTTMGYRKERIRAESAEPKSIDRLRELGLSRIQKADKGKDSVNAGIDFLQDYHIIVHPRCVNFITEISNYTWDTDIKTGKRLNKPIDDFNHLMDAMRYAVESIRKKPKVSFLK
jgi:phage terminase large subunit